MKKSEQFLLANFKGWLVFVRELQKKQKKQKKNKEKIDFACFLMSNYLKPTSQY